MYKRELEAIKRAGRLRERKIFSKDLKDFASNDYLGLAHEPQLLERAYERVRGYGINAAKASQLINGYTPLHQQFEKMLCEANGFAAGITVGSGFMANLAVIEALVRKGDVLFIDEEFHASGNLAAKLLDRVITFAHNDPKHLESLLETTTFNRALVAVEGIYSMSGDLLNPEIVEVADRYGALLLVDEAHSSGVVGERLLGIFDHFGIAPKPTHIKMGTLGKAYGSYGAYILSSQEIVTFLENRAKSIIYTTALSLMDVALAQEGFIQIQEHLDSFKEEIAKRRAAVTSRGLQMDGLILDIPKKDVLKTQERLLQKGYLVGAIRPPTVKEPMIRIIARIGESLEDFEWLLGEVV